MRETYKYSVDECDVDRKSERNTEMKYGCWSFASGDGSGGGTNGRATSLCPSGPGSNPVNLNWSSGFF